MPTWDDVVEIALKFPEAELGIRRYPGAACGQPGDDLPAEDESDALVLRVIDLADREALLLGQPDVFFSTPHYDEDTDVLVRLDVIDPVELSELIEDAWRLRAPKRAIKAYEAT